MKQSRKFPRNLEELTLKEIGEVIKRNIRPKKGLVIEERTKFLEIRPHLDESIVQFVHRLKESVRYCDFERLGSGEITTEDELIILRLIEGIHNPAFKHQFLETLQSVNLTIETYRVREATGINEKKSITNNRTREKRKP